MGRRLAARVRVKAEDGGDVVLGPADEVPEWAAAQITNPFAWADTDDEDAAPAVAFSAAGEAGPTGEDEDAPTGDVVTSTTTITRDDADWPDTPGEDDVEEYDEDADSDYDGMTVVALRALIAERNDGRDGGRLSGEGRKADLIATLQADDEQQ